MRTPLPELSPESALVIARSLRSMYKTQEIQSVVAPRPLLLTDLKIRTKETGVTIPFVPNTIQIDYLNALFPQKPDSFGPHPWESDPTGMRGIRDIILKGRQFGLSTLIIALLFLETVQTPQTSTVIIAHNSETTEKMFQIVHRMYRYLPADRKPKTKYSNKRELRFEEIDSTFYVGQAGSLDFGAGQTLNNVHCSEVPRWPDAKRLMDSLMEAVPAGGNIFVESTALGYGNWYQQEWSKAEEGKSIFTPRFFEWHKHEEYQINPDDYKARGLAIPPPAKKFFEDGPDEEEKEIKEIWDLTDFQLAWRRWKIASQGELFYQNYPLTPQEAFVASGQHYFDNKYLSRINLILSKRDRHGHSDFDPIPYEIPDAFPVLHKYREMLSLWEAPRMDRSYVIGADTAQGLTTSGDPDFDSADVIDAVTSTQVAHFHGHLDTREYGFVLAELGWWYNLALLGVERNNHGHAVLNTLIYEAMYPLADDSGTGGLYLHEEYDRLRGNQRAMIPGWPTNVKTKFLALDWLSTAIDERELFLNNRGSVGEMMSYVKLPGGKAGGEAGTKDDRVISLAIAVAMLRKRPVVPGSYVAGGASREVSYPSNYVSGGNVGASAGGVSRDFHAPLSPVSGMDEPYRRR